MKEFLAVNPETDPDVSQIWAGRQLGEGRASKLVSAAETLCEMMSFAAI